jgi:cysteinyl-tRNA synthetase, unknown class
MNCTVDLKYFLTVIILFLAINILPTYKANATWPPSGWVYQLQNIDLDAIATAAPDVAVIDYSSDGTELTEWTSDQIDILEDADITTLCYFSIGEAEDYRLYWHDEWVPGNPSWLGPENPEWAGNYKVRYWEDGWRAILMGTTVGPDESYLDRILDQGFDGVYLDIIDAYYYWSEEVSENENAAHDMVQLLSDLKAYAVDRGFPNFLIIPQNGEWLPEDVDETDRTLYYSTIDGIGVEDLFNFGDLENNNPANFRTEDAEVIDEVITAGKVVLSVDYLTEQDLIEAYYPLAIERDYAPLATVRALDQLVYFPDLLASAPFESPDLIPSQIEINAYPNPFNSTISVNVSVPMNQSPEIAIFNVSGQLIDIEINGILENRSYGFCLNADDLSAGIYFIKANVAEYSSVRKITLIK